MITVVDFQFTTIPMTVHLIIHLAQMFPVIYFSSYWVPDYKIRIDDGLIKLKLTFIPERNLIHSERYVNNNFDFERTYFPENVLNISCSG